MSTADINSDPETIQGTILYFTICQSYPFEMDDGEVLLSQQFFEFQVPQAKVSCPKQSVTVPLDMFETPNQCFAWSMRLLSYITRQIMNTLVGVAVVLLVALVDILLFTLVYLFYDQNSRKTNSEIFAYSFGTSLFDVVILSGVRFCVLVGASIGVLCNNVVAIQRIQRTSKLMVYFGCGISVYGILKILYFTEDKKDMGVKDWILLSSTLASCLFMYPCWILLSKCKCTRATLSINDEYLIDNSSDHSSEASDGIPEEDNLNKFDREEAKKFTTGRTVIKLLKMTKNDIFYILLAFAFLVACSVAQIFLPFYTGEVINYIVIDKSVEKFKTAMLYMALITFFAGFASGMRAGLFTYVFARYILRLQNLLFTKIMEMEIGFFDIRKTGEITSRLTSDCTKIGDGVGLNVNVFLRNVVKIIGILFFMIKISWKLSIVTLISIPIIAIISEAFGEKYRKLSEKVQNSLAHANESAEEAISSMRTVRSFAAEKDETQRYSERLDVTYSLRKKESMIVCGYRWSTELTDLAMTLLILYYGGHLVMKNDISGGHLVSFILYSIELGFAFEEIGDVYTGLMEAVGASKNVLVYIERKPIVVNKGELCPESGIEGEIRFENVTFAYPSRSDTPVLNNLSFTAKKGEIVALVGPSGGGKTSVVNLLEHFYEPTHGKVLIDGKSIEEYEHAFIHKQISLVQQEPVLFARTITENIAYGLKIGSNLETIKNSAIMANAHNFIQEMPKSYDTETGEKGLQLSGGQKQRIAIARALIRKPSILILDEATSALDAESEYIVQQAINRNLSGRTVIVIAHRLSTIEKADKILVISKGEVVEEGNHEYLINQEGVYASLVSKQLLGMDQEKDNEDNAPKIPCSEESNCPESASSHPKSSYSKTNIKI
ncbi:ABC-type oligopeptide transporter ABCB9-like [Hydractinia symbiolongicarpus]|uniref:ABC-type oligopeptide transporter ABCB9-like n=1 Tax=Hydractinia symbiolongicarpus TaxID=13093 RepID=UPI00254E6538|nr:ABC-type oligopeptide transporter ABCB9-like [Hydractinia symbiolongicarpus]